MGCAALGCALAGRGVVCRLVVLGVLGAEGLVGLAMDHADGSWMMHKQWADGVGSAGTSEVGQRKKGVTGRIYPDAGVSLCDVALGVVVW